MLLGQPIDLLCTDTGVPELLDPRRLAADEVVDVIFVILGHNADENASPVEITQGPHIVRVDLDVWPLGLAQHTRPQRIVEIDGDGLESANPVVDQGKLADECFANLCRSCGSQVP